MAERSDADSIEAGVAMQDGQERFHGGVTLGVDVETGIGEFLEQIGEKRNGMLTRDTRLGDL